MAIWDKLFGEFVDVIEWTDDTADTMVYRFERHGNEIKYGAKLTVRESQAAVFVNEGQIADVFSPGMYELETNNLPVLSTLQSWPHGFESPFKSEVYFFNLKQFIDLKWGTKSPVMLRDKEFAAVRLRAFGHYTFKIVDPSVFLKVIVGTDGHFTTDEITKQLRNQIVARFISILSESGIPVLDLAANYEQLSDYVAERMKPEFLEYGLELSRFMVENISLPDEVEKALDKRTSMGMVRDLNDYVRYQTGVSMEKAASNPSGGGAEGVGIGMAISMAQQLGQNVSNPVPPPVPQTSYFIAIEQNSSGPFSIPEINAKLAAGEITAETLVWKDGMDQWEAAAKINELNASSGVKPPPIPK